MSQCFRLNQWHQLFHQVLLLRCHLWVLQLQLLQLSLLGQLVLSYRWPQLVQLDQLHQYHQLIQQDQVDHHFLQVQ